uniref:Uncharacterized protein n=1 Tax=Eutreptiella gymnastica TaxID=73025 RepID=A0A7S4FVE1_9EUGL
MCRSGAAMGRAPSPTRSTQQPLLPTPPPQHPSMKESPLSASGVDCRGQGAPSNGRPPGGTGGGSFVRSSPVTEHEGGPSGPRWQGRRGAEGSALAPELTETWRRHCDRGTKGST